MMAKEPVSRSRNAVEREIIFLSFFPLKSSRREREREREKPQTFFAHPTLLQHFLLLLLTTHPQPHTQQHDDGTLRVYKKVETRAANATHGLVRALASNMVVGTSTGFTKTLTMIGVGYRSSVAGNKLTLNLGYSHPIEMEVPKGLEVKVEKTTTIHITGADKAVVGQFAADIRKLRPPEPYKGKGVRYEDEYVRRKEGKRGK